MMVSLLDQVMFYFETEQSTEQGREGKRNKKGKEVT